MTTLTKTYEVCLLAIAQVESELVYWNSRPDTETKTEKLEGLNGRHLSLAQKIASLEEQMQDDAVHDQLTRDHY
jgi:hypothetical protein